jgi:outer membrane protein OmpA-like peptidoglycan-associated protein
MTYGKTSAALALSALLAATACTVTDPNNPNRNAQQAALIGAGMGAIIGNSSGGKDGAIKGAIIGGTIGAIAGNQLDKQEAELRAQMGSQVGIVNTGNQLIVTMPQDILFATDSASLTGSLRSDLYTLAASLNRYPGSTVNVVGHTDNVGTAAYNQDLSERRARAVASVLTDGGVSPYRIVAFGRGEDQPIATNLTAEGRQQNRRVEIIITPNG